MCEVIWLLFFLGFLFIMEIDFFIILLIFYIRSIKEFDM